MNVGDELTLKTGTEFSKFFRDKAKKNHISVGTYEGRYGSRTHYTMLFGS